MRWPFRLATAAACSLPIVLPIAWVLAARVANVVDIPLVEGSPSREAVPIELSYVDYPGRPGPHTAAMLLQLQRAESLAEHARIDLLVATYDTAPELLRATLSVDGTDCGFESRPGAQYPNNGILTLMRSKECSRLTGTPTGRLRLEVRFDGPGRTGLWTYRAPAEPIRPSRIYLSDPTYAEQGVLCEVRGSYVDKFVDSHLRRIDQLAYVWDIAGDQTQWIWLALILCGALLTAAALVVPVPSAAFGTLRMATALGTAALAFAGLYAVVIPPFQAADEPSHLITVLGDIGQAQLATDVTVLAQRDHFERIHFHPEERFRPADRTAPGAAVMKEADAADAFRGMGVRYVWRVIAPVVRSFDAAHVLLSTRLIHGAIFGAAVAAFVMLTAFCSDLQRPGWLALPILLVPTLPFFAMYVSNYAPLSSVYVVLGAGVLVSMLGGPRSHYGGGVVGICFTLAVLMSRSALPLAPFVVSVLAARILTGGGPNASRRFAMLFWAGSTLPICGGIWLLQWDYFDSLWNALIRAFGQVLVPRESLSLMVLLAGVAGYLAERGAARLWQSLEPRSNGTITRYAAGLLAALLAITMAASLIWSPPVLALIDPAHPPSSEAYVRSAVLAGLTVLRPGSPDFLTSVAFWQGFGWLETIPSVALASLLATASGLAFIGLLLWVARTRATRILVWICCAILGYAATFATYALSVIRLTPADLHGRYLLGLYICMLLIAWSGLPRLASSNRRMFRAVPAAVALACVAIHAYCLTAILRRYF